MLDALKAVKPTRALRVLACVLIGIGSFVVAKAASGDFVTNFGNFLTFLLYLLIPWTAVNLVDFYFVRRGHYSIQELFKPRGMYGRVGIRGVTAYVVGFAVMIPFFTTRVYTGPVAHSLDGVDLSVFVGLPVSAFVYWILCRSLSRAGLDTDVIAEEDPGLQARSLRHERPAPAA
jgi:NCS1 family nucleobase:cation symporter-1